MAEPSAATQGGGGLLGKWMEELLKNGGTPLTNPKDITDKLKSDLVKTWNDLKKWVTRGKDESNEIKNFCENIKETWPRSNKLLGGAVKEMCKAAAEIRYFMSGVETKGGKFRNEKDETPKYETVEGPEAYRRCVVGALVLNELYGDHCYLGDAIKHMSQSVEKKLQEEHNDAIANLEACKGITAKDLIVAKAVLGDTIKEWEQTTKESGRASKWRNVGFRLGKPWMSLPSACGGGKQGNGKETEEKNKDTIGNFLKVGSDTNRDQIMNELISDKESLTIGDLKRAIMSSMQNDGTPNVDTLMKNVGNRIQKNEAQECMKDSSKEFCVRLKCAKEHWELNEGQGGNNNSDELWGKRVKNEFDNLFTRGTASNGGTQGAKCDKDKDLDSANKEACKHITAKLENIYTTTGGKHQLSDQIVQCLLLRAYAEKLNERAKQEGYCDIQPGIKRAFEFASAIKTTNCRNNKSCIVCNLNDYNQLDSCPIGKDATDKVKSKVDEWFKNDQTKSTKMQQTLADFNKENTLCKRIQCASKWYENKGSGQNKFWNEHVKKLWEELAGAMTTDGKKENRECAKVPDTNGINGTSGQREATHSEKTACNYLHAGLSKLYSKDATSAAAPAAATSTTVDDNILKNNPSFRQTMGCFLLHAYAKIMKEKAICNIDKGITQAFESWNVSSNGNCNGKEPCVPCHWKETDYENCSINTSGAGATGHSDKVENKLKDIVHEKDGKIVAMAAEVNKIESLCKRFQCISERWLKQKNGKKDKSLTNEDWKKVWEGDDGVKNELKELSQKLKGKNDSLDQYCNGLDDKTGKDACLLIAAGLKNLYETTGNGDPIDASFKRTMQCVLLNAIADEMKEKLPCKEERSVLEGINKAFDNSGEIKNKSSGCNDVNKCFTCERFNEYRSCQIRENSSTLKVTMLEGKVDDVLKNGAKEEMKKIKEVALKEICKPCTNNGETLCNQLDCIRKKWGQIRNQGDGASWDDMRSDFEKELKALLTYMKEETNQNAVAHHCSGHTAAGWEAGAAKEANETACKLIAAGLQHISKIQHEYNESGTKPEENKNPYDNQEFKQLVSCLMLKAVVQKMKEDSKICDIQPGIDAAFKAASQIKNDHCTNDKPCIVCEIGQDDKDKLDGCTIGSSSKDKVKDKLNDLLNSMTNKPNVDSTLKEVLKTDQPNGVPLCSRLECLASRDNFWKEDGGEVANLWKELSQAIIEEGKNGSGTECGTMEDGINVTRDATEPEKKACQYLTAGFNKLKQSSHSNDSSYTILTNPLLRQTVGCFLLKEYAKKMQNQSKCVITSGLKKAFDSWNPTSNVNCTNGSSCIECEWDDNEYDKCQITTNDKTEIAKTKVQGMVEGGTTLTTTMKDINTTESLCQQLQCAGPKWFKNNQEKNGGGTPTNKTWCDFWDTAVKNELKTMFDNIAQNGQNNKDFACKDFGDGNENSVERKACNHIAAGLKHIFEVQGGANGGTPNSTFQADDKFFKQTMMCAALNLYATKIRDATENICPIDEEKINEMFTKWNANHNSLSSTSPPCNGGGSTNVCFKCTRQPNFNGCKLSVDTTLVDETNGSCSFNEDKKDVQTQMKELLNNEDQSNTNSIKSKINSTLTTITEMTSSFCTQLQCAAKKWKSSKNGKNGPIGTPSWVEMKSEIDEELKKLLGHMLQADKQKEVEQYCKNDTEWNAIGHKQGKTNKAACLLFASGLQHIYTHDNGRANGRVNGPSFGQTMGCLFLKEYAKQLQKMANEKKQGHSWVHPKCDIKEGIDHAFGKSKDIMKSVLPQCSKDTNGNNSCFVCTQNNDYGTCKIGIDSVKDNVEPLLKKKSDLMEKTLENTVCPILLTDLLTPFLPLAPVSIGLSAMAYYLWKYFGPLGKGGPRFRRSPEIPGSSVQEQVLDHAQQDSSHEYRLVKERKPRSAPTRTKRSGGVNRRTIIEIHFEVLDECQKGDTQLNQKDFLELLVQEFMGSEFMEEEQVPKEEVLMEDVPMENVPMEGVPSLASGFMV
ncbi:SICAvar, type I [Plasmodium knowlesi strain H]|uniref:SICAvar, type I n=3 Tax=Plasmodium knowlesi TaxID=5850 RepID=A0A5E7WX73_PLAKH|nr:SICAvar, type I [Plasmodium knowlesi strain H]OTN68185.1 SICAvar type I [Plasmodium knowlesi]CAA9987216.1 SICAvar, type I [Plasmodium knowlesi strain H]SBO23982.1 SICAvar, type I [Plasmodium knowlesi strain H]SBO25954.1 SICAvar, type I [Plasmodium knowlesi strain H]VVS76690.1 SICAvar, type I [Plasmodium knowlesi strain H]